MKVLFFWEPAGLSLDKANPYAALLAQAMRALGVELEAGFRKHLKPDFLETHQTDIDVLHLNWPSGLYAHPDPQVTLERINDLAGGLLCARSLGMRVVWTMHNLYPHDSATPELDRFVRLAITACADSVIVHCQYAREQLRRHFFRRHGVFTIPHGNFIAPYSNTVSRAEARARIGIDPNCFVYLFFGTVRANKGLEQLIDAFHRIPDHDCRLLLAARITSDYGGALVERAERMDPRIVVQRSRFYANDEFQLYYNAADIAVFPFTDILTSGSVITALSMGCPVVVPAIGCLTELIDAEIGLTYQPEGPDALLDSLIAARRRDLVECRAAAIERMRALHWDDIARRTLDAYRFRA